MTPRELLDRLKQRWQSLSQVKKAFVIIAGTGILAATLYLITFLTQTSYTPLMTNLEPRDAGAIEEKLKSLKYEDFKLADQGTTIMVPKEQVYEIRIKLASSGVLQGGGLGFELFDQNQMGVSDFEQQVDYQRALQEELRRTISQLEEVEQARVHLVLPQKSVFVDEQEPASVSIALKLKPLAKLKPEQVKGIADLAVGSIQGLKLENVHIIDMQGHILSDTIDTENDEDSSQVINKQQQVRREYEKELEKRIQNVLDRVLGTDKAVSMVTAEMDFNKQEINTTTHGPGQKVSEQLINEKSQGTGLGGVTGTDAQNTQTYPTGTDNVESASRDESITNYQVDTTQQKVVQPPGTIKKLSTSVVVDGKLSATRIQQIESLVSTAIGYDQARGDQINVTNIAFDTSYQDKMQAEMGKEETLAAQKQRQQLIYFAIAGAIIFLIMSAFLIAYIRRRRRRQSEDTLEESIKSVQDLIEEEQELEVKYIDVKNDQIKKLARERPQDIAEILKIWLSEG
jgi:flagellar M-ring protein FliF